MQRQWSARSEPHRARLRSKHRRPLWRLPPRPLPGDHAGRDWADLSRAEQEKVLDGHRLVYLSDSLVNWCPGLGTVLANEEVTAEGRSERGNYPVFQRNLRQWMMRITAYADRLVDDLDSIDWPEKVRIMQRNWIGRSQGATVRFALPSRVSVGEAAGDDGGQQGATDLALEVFTTRPDTLFGATFMVVAPEHPLVDDAVPATWPDGTKDAWTGGHASPAEAVAAEELADMRAMCEDHDPNTLLVVSRELIPAGVSEAIRTISPQAAPLAIVATHGDAEG